MNEVVCELLWDISEAYRAKDAIVLVATSVVSWRGDAILVYANGLITVQPERILVTDLLCSRGLEMNGVQSALGCARGSLLQSHESHKFHW